MKGWHCNMPRTRFVQKRSVTDSSVYFSPQYVVINPLQVFMKANYSGVTSGGVWDHFITAIAPAIQTWQLFRSEKEGSSII